MYAPVVINRRSRLRTFFGSSYGRATIAVMLVLVGYVLLFAYFIDGYTTEVYHLRQQHLRRLVEMGLNTVEPLRAMSVTGDLTPFEARSAAVDLVRRMVYSDDSGENFMFMITFQGEILVNPFDRAMEGTNQWALTGPDGQLIVQDMIRAAVRSGGSDFISYTFPPPTGGPPQHMLAYVVGVPEWNVFIGTALSMVDIETGNQTYLISSLLLSSLLTITMLSIIYITIRPTIHSYQTLSDLFDRITLYPDEFPPVPLAQYRPGSEGWRLLAGFQDMLTRIQRSKRAAEEIGDALREREAQYRSIFESSSDALVIFDRVGTIVEANPAACRLYGSDYDSLIGTDGRRYLPLSALPVFDHFLVEVYAGKDFNEPAAVQGSDGTITNIEVHGTAFAYKGEPHALAVLRDITDRLRTYQVLEQHVAERTHELTSLLHVSQSLTSTLELKPLLQLILDQLQSVVDYNGAAIFTLEDDELLRLLIYTGPIPAELLPELWSLERDLIRREVITGAEPIIIADVHADRPRARAFREAVADYLDYMNSWMGVPLIVREEIVGMIAFDHTEPGYYTPRHANLALAFASSVAAAIENANLYTQTSQRADEMQTLLTIQRAITSRLDPDVILQMIADEGRRLTNARRSVVSVFKGDYMRLAAVSGEPSPDQDVGQRLADDADAVLDTAQMRRLQDEAALDRRARSRATLLIPLISDSGPIGVLSVSDKLSGSFVPDDERLLSTLAAGAVIGLDNARLYQREQERLREAEQRRRVAEGLRDILAALNSNRKPEDILDYIITQAGRLLGTDTVALYRLQAQEQMLTIQTARGLPEEYAQRMSVPVGAGVVGQAVQRRTPYYVTSLRDSTAEEAGGEEHPRAELLRYLMDTYQSLLGVPLLIKDEVYGGIVLYYREKRRFSEEEIALAAAFGDQAALAIENARLRDQMEHAAAAAERQRLARDLHDAVTQTLFSASLIADVLPRLWQRRPDEALRRVDELRELTRGALAEMRTLLLELRPATLTEVTLAELLTQLVEAMVGRARLPVALDVQGDCPPLPPDIQVALYRIAQESLNNVSKHAHAHSVSVQLKCAPGRVGLCIVDDGRGFDPALVPADHLGIGIMQERAAAIGAQFTLTSAPGAGTRLEVIWTDSSLEA